MVLPFHHILYFCDAASTTNMLCVSEIHHAIIKSDVVRGFARRSGPTYDVTKVPSQYVSMYVKHKIELGEDQSFKDFTLRWASRAGHLELVKYLVRSVGANVQNQANHPLSNAISFGHLEMAKFLVSEGANVRACGGYPLSKAIESGDLNMVKFLLSAGVAFGGISNDLALSHACYSGHKEVVEYLISFGADVRRSNDQAVRCACKGGQLEVVKYLASLGADVRAEDDIAMCWASKAGHLEVVKYLVSVGAEVGPRNNLAVRWASQAGHSEVVEYLISVGCAPPAHFDVSRDIQS